MTNFVSKVEANLRTHHDGKAAVTLKKIIPTIIERWEIAARELVPIAKKKDSLVLQDELSNLLENVAEALRPGNNSYDSKSNNEISRAHGQHRAITEGYSLDQMLQEYSLLRKTILWSLLEIQPLTETERDIIHDSIDKAMKISAQYFSEAQKGQINIALQKAELSNQDLEHFAAIAAHDLKSPLNTITGFLEAIYEELSKDITEDTKTMFDFVLQATERMRNLTDRLLSYASLKATVPEFSQVCLNDVCSKAVANLKNYIESRHATVTYQNLPLTQGDIILLVQLFQNLLTNGIKYNTQLEPHVEVTCEDQGDYSRINFTDNGIGIKEEDKKYIFKPFKRLHAKKEFQGSGLGLATCCRILELHRGHISITSEVGKGTTFHVDLPKALSKTATPKNDDLN